MKLVFSILFSLLAVVVFAQPGSRAGAGVGYSDSIPTHTPNPLLRHSTVVRDLSKSQLYNYDASWKRLPNETEIIFAVDSIQQLTSMDSFVDFRLGDLIIVRPSLTHYMIMDDSTYLVDSILSFPVDTNYAVIQPGFSPSSEFKIGMVADSGIYNLQVEGNTYLDDQLVALDHKQYANEASSTDGSGDITVTFGTAFSVAPSVVIITSNDATPYIHTVTAKTTTTFTVRIYDTAGAAVTSTAMDFDWLAIR